MVSFSDSHELFVSTNIYAFISSDSLKWIAHEFSLSVLLRISCYMSSLWPVCDIRKGSEMKPDTFHQRTRKTTCLVQLLLGLSFHRLIFTSILPHSNSGSTGYEIPSYTFIRRTTQVNTVSPSAALN